MCRVIQPPEVGEFQCNVLLAVDYDIKGGTLLPLRLSRNKSVTGSTDVTVILIPLQQMANLILEQIAVINDEVETNYSNEEIDDVYDGDILPGGEESQWKSKAILGYDIKGGTQPWTLYFFSHLSSYVQNVLSLNRCEVFNRSNNHENFAKKYCNEFVEIKCLTLLSILDSGPNARMMSFPKNISHPPASLGNALFLVTNNAKCYLISNQKCLSQLHYDLLDVISLLPAKEQIFSPTEAMDEKSSAVFYFYSLLRSIPKSANVAWRKIIIYTIRKLTHVSSAAEMAAKTSLMMVLDDQPSSSTSFPTSSLLSLYTLKEVREKNTPLLEKVTALEPMVTVPPPPNE
jgi:hypothetical protein